MAKKHMKRRSASLIIREIKTTVRYHLTPVRIIKKPTNNKCWQGCGKMGNLMLCRWNCKLVLPLWKTVWWFLKKLKLELPYSLAISLLGIYLKKTIKKTNSKKYMHPYVHCSITYNNHDMEAT